MILCMLIFNIKLLVCFEKQGVFIYVGHDSVEHTDGWS